MKLAIAQTASNQNTFSFTRTIQITSGGHQGLFLFYNALDLNIAKKTTNNSWKSPKRVLARFVRKSLERPVYEYVSRFLLPLEDACAY